MDNKLEKQTSTLCVLDLDDLRVVMGEFVEEAIKKREEEARGALITKKQVSLELNVDASTLWRWEKAHYLTPVRIGSKVMYYEKDVQRMKEGRV